MSTDSRLPANVSAILADYERRLQQLERNNKLGGSVVMGTPPSLANGTDTQITAYVTEVDPSGLWNSTTHCFTAPHAGWYDMTASVGFSSTLTSGRFVLYLVKNGNSGLRYASSSAPAGASDVNVSTSAYMAKGETAEVWGWQSTGASLTLYNGFGECRFTFHARA